MEALVVLKSKCSVKRLKLSRSASHNSSRSKASKQKKVEHISKPKRLDRYVAVAEYAVQAPGEMLLYPGLRVDVLEKSDSGWWFVNSEDEQGWVPSTYLEPESEESESAAPAAVAEPGQEENFICIEKFEGASADEVSLEKGAVVQVLQKNLDGWWLVRYMGREAYAPGTYLKKATSGQTHSLVEKSRLSGVQIISSLQDVSPLLTQSKKSDIAPPAARSSLGNKAAACFVKTKSMERGGSLMPPPRKNSVTKVDTPLSMRKSSLYVTIEDFEDTVGDGLSFRSGQEVQVKEKTATGWWFVKIDEEEGWVPASYLESSSKGGGQTEIQESNYETNRASYVFPDEFSEEEWYDLPDEEKPLDRPDESKKGFVDMSNRPLPPIPPEEEQSVQESAKGGSSSPRMARRPLPAAPVLSPPGKSGPIILPVPKKPSQTKNVDSVVPKVAAKPKDPMPAQDLASGGDNQDFASILKAKFAARSGVSVDSGNSSEEDSTKPSNHRPDKPKMQPIVPKKPSEIKKDLESHNQLSDSAAEDVTPPPRTKNKPLKPPSLPSKPGGNSSAPSPGVKPSFPGVQLKPVSKPGSAGSKASATPGANSNSPAVLQKGSVKSIGAALTESSNLRPKSAEKPFMPGKPEKPLIPGKPEKPFIPGKPKPGVAAKPSIASKPAVLTQKPGQSVNNLANSLSGKLNFGKQVNSQPQEPSPTPANVAKKLSAVPPGSAVSRSYVALFDFVAENDGEIGFNEGDELEVLEQRGEWSLVRIWDEEGWAPTNYLQEN
ncbi:Sh3 and px domain-containing protein 2b [Plakobranchus ocellatus]|uniref:Sh3 and px domain-containing protein 2b n=1 Tax=Plakobranchus ocellatus TaxID=259542 RepID=A0AAV3YPC5_9GAST|nr:Sh3 and px domain-containing protein 2b [Plakobranchus ocellatus]